MCAAEVLIDGDKLESVLGHEDLRLYDCTTWLVPDPPNIYRVESGRESYETGHIVGANFLDFTNELSDPNSDLNFMKSLYAIVSALINPFSKSVCIFPAA